MPVDRESLLIKDINHIENIKLNKNGPVRKINKRSVFISITIIENHKSLHFPTMPCSQDSTVNLPLLLFTNFSFSQNHFSNNNKNHFKFNFFLRG